METKSLLEGESLVGGSRVMTTREWAASVLGEVAQEAYVGSYPQHISAFDLGRALNRATINSDRTEDEFFRMLIMGWLHTANQREST